MCISIIAKDITSSVELTAVLLLTNPRIHNGTLIRMILRSQYGSGNVTRQNSSSLPSCELKIMSFKFAHGCGSECMHMFYLKNRKRVQKRMASHWCWRSQLFPTKNFHRYVRRFHRYCRILYFIFCSTYVICILRASY